MFRNSIAIFLTLILIGVIVTPTIVSVVDDSIDVSILYGCADEVEKESEKNKIFELIFSDSENDEFDLGNSRTLTSLSYRSNDYPKPHLNLIFPPPEFI